ncbi:MAG: Gfo/Idh/MocA family oxidoreductase, partial [Caldilineaceae bacterium]|nr:Gfo/Idh/MocA family oxidoreductase [Caldilineaceae bacterium]
CGDVAQRDYLPEFHRLAERAELVAVCSRRRERAQAVAAAYQIPQVFTDYRQMLAESNADAVINLTPIQQHFATALATLQAGKHLYCEKPVAGTVAEANVLKQVAQQQGLTLVCAPCVMLFPQVRYAKTMIDSGAIGAVYSAYGYGHMGVPPWRGYTSDPTPFFAKGGGPARDMGVYPLHTLTGILGPVKRVSALVTKVLDSFTPVDGPMAGQRIAVEAEDNWQLLLDFGEGRLASLAANNIVVGSRAPQVEIHGLGGTIALDPIDVSTPVELLQTDKGWQVIPPPFALNAAVGTEDAAQAAKPTGRQAGPDHHLGVEHLVDCIVAHRQPVLSIDHARHVIEIIEQAAQSARDGVIKNIETSF